MLATVILAIIGLIFLIGLFVTFGSSTDDGKFSGIATAITSGLIFLIVGAFTCLTVVGPTEVGIPVSFGRVGDPMTSGLQLKAPWTGVETYPTRPFPVADFDVKARTNQGGSVTLATGSRWNVVEANARSTFEQVRTGDEERITNEVVKPALATAIGTVIAKRDNQKATTDRQDLDTELRTAVNEITKKFGIYVSDVFVRSSEPDERTARSIADFAIEQQRTQIAKQAIETAKQQALANQAQAAGLKAAVAQLPNVTPQQAALLCVQTWDRVVSQATQAGQSIYTNPCGSAQGPLITAAPAAK